MTDEEYQNDDNTNDHDESSWNFNSYNTIYKSI